MIDRVLTADVKELSLSFNQFMQSREEKSKILTGC